MKWIYSKEVDDDIRTCNICKLSQIKTKDGDWAVYLTYARIEQSFKCTMLGIREECSHTPEEDSE